MSYDLYFLVPEERAAVSIEDFGGYFAARPRYRVDGAQAIYRNEDTGVELLFDYFDPESDAHDMTGLDDEEGELEALHADGWKPAQVSVSVNYLRSHVVGLEAAPEIEAFIGAFDLSVDDPQTDGMGRGPFSNEGFLRGWSEGNRFAYHAAVEHFIEKDVGDPRSLPALPKAELERCWRWNQSVEALQERLGENVSVPTIRFLRDSEGVRTFVAWTDASQAAIPQADLVALVRDELAPRTGLLRRKKTSIALVPHAEVQRALDDTKVVTDHVEPFRLVESDEPSALVLNLFDSAPVLTHEPEGVRAESVLNQEILDEALEQAAGQTEA